VARRLEVAEGAVVEALVLLSRLNALSLHRRNVMPIEVRLSLAILKRALGLVINRTAVLDYRVYFWRLLVFLLWLRGVGRLVDLNTFVDHFARDSTRRISHRVHPLV